MCENAQTLQKIKMVVENGRSFSCLECAELLIRVPCKSVLSVMLMTLHGRLPLIHRIDSSLA